MVALPPSLSVSWRTFASCRRHPDIDDCPDASTSEDEARAVRAECLVWRGCLECVLAKHEPDIWGETDERERARMSRQGRGYVAVDRLVRPTETT